MEFLIGIIGGIILLGMILGGAWYVMRDDYGRRAEDEDLFQVIKKWRNGK